jgi:hypothetical protein
MSTLIGGQSSGRADLQQHSPSTPALASCIPFPLTSKATSSVLFSATVGVHLRLTRYEAESAFSLSLVRHGRLQADAVWDLKCQTLKKSGLLQLYRGGEDFSSLDSKSHMQRDVGLAWLDLPLVPPETSDQSRSYRHDWFSHEALCSPKLSHLDC